MLTKARYRSFGEHARGGSLLTLGVFAGILIGYLLALSLLSMDAEEFSSEESGPFSSEAPPAALLAPGEGLLSLDQLHIEISAAGVRVIQAARQRAIDAGIIETQAGDTVAAIIRAQGRDVPARIRLKGDWIDHVETDKWSLRIELEGDTLYGMSRFSIQNPSTRGFLMEWMVMEMARREGILAPRSRFVAVTINGRPSGMYYLEEHFTKEMLESQGRREGPIVRFNESTLWTTWLQYGRPSGKEIPEPARFADSISDAELSSFDEQRMSSSEALNQRLQSALSKMRDLQRLLLLGSDRVATGRAIHQLEQLTAMDALQGRTIDALFDAVKLGRWLALYCLVNAEHGTSWIQWRFYHDSVLDRLEPIVFDTGALGGEMGLVRMMNSVAIKEFLRSGVAYEEFIRSLRRFSKPGYLQEFLVELAPELSRYGRALAEEQGSSIAGLDLAKIMIDAMLPSAASLQAALSPVDAIQFHCTLVPAGSGETEDRIEIEAWSTTWTPVLLEGFRFSNGRLVSAAAILSDGRDDLRRPRGRVLLPHQGSRVRFSLPTDARIAGLRRIEAIKQSARTGEQVDRAVRIKLRAVYRLVGDDDSQSEALLIRRAAVNGRLAGRPQASSLEQLLLHHRCLGYDWQEDRLFLRPGTWQVDGDLIIPAGHILTATPGTTLLFAAEAVFSSGSALDFVGTEELPIVLAAQDSELGWSGLLVHGCRERSSLEHVVVRECRGIDRGSWQSPGGVSFYRASVTIVDSRFEDSFAEDALNIVSADLLLERVSFIKGVSDLFDGDFVTGSIRDCDFKDSLGDGIDASGSHLQIDNCRLSGIGDKAISAGEGSSLEVSDCVVTGASIAVAAKDSSQVRIQGLVASQLEHYLIAAYIKKSEYGPASVNLTGLQYPDAEQVAILVQTGCRVELEGKIQPSIDVDVAEMYRRGILGK